MFPYDGFNRLVKTKVTVKTSDSRLVDHITRYSYDLNGNKTKETDWLGNEWKYDYDPLNRLTAKYEPGGSVPVHTLLRGRFTILHREICSNMYNITISGCARLVSRGYELICRNAAYAQMFDELVNLGNC